MRDVAELLDRLQLPWYLTGSEALSAYGSPRQTMDTDIVIDADVKRLGEVARALEASYYYAEPLRIEKRWMASLVDQAGRGKVDLIVRDPDAWSREATARRQRWAHPVWGPIWVSSLEDLILAKLEWSEGTSELQLRDCQMLLRMNVNAIDRDYLTRWARGLGVDALLAAAWESDSDAS